MMKRVKSRMMEQRQLDRQLALDIGTYVIYPSAKEPGNFPALGIANTRGAQPRLRPPTLHVMNCRETRNTSTKNPAFTYLHTFKANTASDMAW